MRVLHIMSGFGGGISSFIYNKAIALNDKNIVFDVATYDECSTLFTDAIHSMGGQIYRLENPKKVGWRKFKTTFEKILNEHDYQAIHCHITGYRALAYFLVSRHYVKRFFLHAHMTKALHVTGFKQKLLRKLDQTINKFITDSYVGCGRLANIAIYGPIPVEQMMVIPNSISTERYLLSDDEFEQRRNQLKAQYGLDDQTFVIGQIGRLHKVKNQEHTLRLAEYIRKYQLKAKIFIIGSGADFESLNQLVATKDLKDYVTFLGRIDKTETVMPMLDVLIMPSLYEGLPTVVVEAQTVGIPCLMSDTITDEVDFDKGQVDYLSLNEPIANWYQSLKSLSQVPRLSKNEREQILVERGFTNEQSAQIYLDFLNQKINSYLIK